MKTSAFRLAFAVLLLAARPDSAWAQSPPPVVPGVEFQPLAAQVRRIIDAMDLLGEPFSAADRAALEKVMSAPDNTAGEKLQRILDAHVLFIVYINREMRVKVAQGPAKPELVEQGWRQFLVKVANEPGSTAPLLAISPNAQRPSNSARNQMSTVSDRYYRHPDLDEPVPPAAGLWFDLQNFESQPLRATLSGLAVEYRIVQLYSRDAGRRDARVFFTLGPITRLGLRDDGAAKFTPEGRPANPFDHADYRSELDVLFTCRPTGEIKLRVLDEHGEPATASFTIRDAAGRVHPSQAKRLAPDFAFHPQVYRSDGESLRLPDGEYQVRFERGPESVPQNTRATVGAHARELKFQVKRWIDPAKFGWWSGDHHIHAAGCRHYTNPTEGVHAPDMARHISGEDLKVGANLTWGPCFDYQKQFFTGKDDTASRYPYLLHYDIEVSGFGSHQSGHLCLLRLREQMYPGGESSAHWPTLGLNTLRWAKKQGAVTGPAHSGFGLHHSNNRNFLEVRPPADDLPNYVVPPFNGIGANEYIMDVTHEVPGPDGKLVPAVDFISTVDTPCVWELNIWYHTLNAGFRTRISGETDFPCVYGERVGMGRSYVKLDGRLNYEEWCEGIRQGRTYVGDGQSHLMDFNAALPSGSTAAAAGRGPVTTVRLGEHGSEMKLARPGTVTVSARVAARLNEQPNPAIRDRSYTRTPYWDIERARMGETREVPVEVIVNGLPVMRKTIIADGELRHVSFDVPVERSSWVALRILPSSHTNPIWVIVGDKPVRASRRSIEWCLKGVNQCWSQKERFIAAAELPQARADYEHARQVYRQRLQEAEVD